MKKILIATILILTLALSTLCGCTFVEKDQERDLSLIVATVKTGDVEDKITKRELVSYFNNNAYYYMYYYGMSAEEVMDYLIGQLVNRKIVIQEAERTLPVKNEGTVVGNRLEKFLTANQINAVKKSLNESLNNTIKTYMDLSEKSTGDVRTVPTYEKEDVEEIVTEKDIPAVLGTESDAAAEYVSALDELQKDLVKNFYGKNNAEAFENYKKEVAKNLLEEQILTLWEENVKKSVSPITFAELQIRFNEMKESQTTSYESPADYKDALDKASSSEFVLFNKAAGYGYVYNLLIPFDTYQTNELAKVTTSYQAGKITTAEYEAIRAQLLENVYATDLRESWVTAGYLDFKTMKFKDEYCKTDIDFVKKFNGTVTYTYKKSERDENGKKVEKEYKAVNEQIAELDLEVLDGEFTYDLNKIPVEEFWEKVNECLEGKTEAEKLDIMKDLTFAYGSDTGILNSFKGYVSAPKPADNASETYVAEFAKAAREIVEEGVGAKRIVGTQYGWHYLYCTDTLKTSETLVEADMNTFGTFTYRFKKVMEDKLLSSELSRIQSEKIFEFKDNEKFVKLYPETYKDLLETSK